MHRVDWEDVKDQIRRNRGVGVDVNDEFVETESTAEDVRDEIVKIGWTSEAVKDETAKTEAAGEDVRDEFEVAVVRARGQIGFYGFLLRRCAFRSVACVFRLRTRIQ